MEKKAADVVVGEAMYSSGCPIWAEPTDLEIHEDTTGASLSTETSPTTESITLINPRINLGKCEHLCQVSDLNPGGQVLPQGIQPTDPWSVRCSDEDLRKEKSKKERK
ncbi:uncharacterized protein LOC110432953 [Sorghum bicolor]|uniref:uncharacterized protein LOC110432953 n=1 Tax=Sorghum bicolor TaxID=4558 RepID=UPI000B425833|nr:uncharacterized protein LOC110432953 [Sorghum bicolor]|eukprot:XP_021309936.1 uncharacterized protein LOC110432953 [Sorghum bicolor]